MVTQEWPQRGKNSYVLVPASFFLRVHDVCETRRPDDLAADGDQHRSQGYILVAGGCGGEHDAEVSGGAGQIERVDAGQGTGVMGERQPFVVVDDPDTGIEVAQGG
jgi:hypothetical protein